MRLVLTRGLQYFLPFWYSKEPMFWLPKGWFPYYAEWILSFPRAPLGSLSIGSWQLACSGFITIVSDVITAILGLVLGKSLAKQQPAKVGVPGQASSSQEAKDKKDS